MRTDPRYTRVRNMLTVPEVPRLANGGIALCHLCQRAVYFANGFLSLLVRDLQRTANGARAARSNANLSLFDPTLTMDAVMQMTDGEARAAFLKIRWANNDGRPYCGRCGSESLYRISTRDLWKCSACGFQFSATTGTALAYRKKGFRDYLLIIASRNEGENPLQLSKRLGSQYKTTYLLAHKLRAKATA